MDALLNELKMMPGLIGSFVYTNKNGVVGSDLPRLFRLEALKKVGGLLSRTQQMTESVGMELTGFEIKYEESLMLIKGVDRGAILVVICEPNVSLPLVTMSASMLLPELKLAIAEREKAPAVKTQPTIKTPVATPEPAQKVDAESILKNGPLSGPLSQMKMALAHAMGPMANLIIIESIELWIKNGPANQARLQELAKILAAEINNADQESAFMAEVKHLL